MKDNEPLGRRITAYSRKDDSYQFEVEIFYIDIDILRDIFCVSADDPDPATRMMAYCYEVGPEQIQALEKYLPDFEVNFDEYDYMLEAYGEKILGPNSDRY